MLYPIEIDVVLWNEKDGCRWERTSGFARFWKCGGRPVRELTELYARSLGLTNEKIGRPHASTCKAKGVVVFDRDGRDSIRRKRILACCADGCVLPSGKIQSYRAPNARSLLTQLQFLERLIRLLGLNLFEK